MNMPDKIYEEWIKETDAIGIKGDWPAVEVVGELTRALKRVCNRNGGTAVILNGVRYDINDNVIEETKEVKKECTCGEGHICDGDLGHNWQECPYNCPVHGKEKTKECYQRVSDEFKENMEKTA